MKSALLKDSVRQIKNTFKRFLSILLIVLLGVGFFAGIKATSPDMKEAIDKYFDDQNMMDIEVISTLGITNDDINALKEIKEVKQVNPAYAFDAIVATEGKDIVVKALSLDDNMNKVSLIDGRLPEKNNECVVEKSFLTGTKTKIGDYIELKPEEIDADSFNLDKEDNKDEKKSPVKENKVKIVGTIESPEYISRSRGNSKLGSGSVNYYMYLPKSNIEMDVYTVAYITVDGAKELKTYENNYEDLIENVKDKIGNVSKVRKKARYDEIIDEANSKLNDAQKEYDEQKKKAEDEINDAQNKLDDAKKQLENGKNEIVRNEKKANSEFASAQNKIKDGENKLNNARKELETKKAEANKKINQAEGKLNSLKEVKSQYDSLKNKKVELEKQIKNIDGNLLELNKNPEVNVEKIQELNIKKLGLEEALKGVNYGILQIETNLKNQGIEASKLDITIEGIVNGINSAKNELANAQNQIASSSKELEKNKINLENTKKRTYREIENGKKELEKAKIEIEENEKKLEDARKEADEKLEDAQEKLNDAKNKIGKIEKPSWFILDRNSNYGYVEYMQDTDRIANLSKVFPVVFFLVAALISLTSMSRMIEEQRVQIGTLKALGYNKVEISFKYIIYALLATIIGGVLGMLIGFNMLPRLIYSMYEMMYTLPGIDYAFRLDIGLKGLLFALICTVGSTIYTCYHELKEKPASLMLPRAPKPGKRIILERIPFIWNKMKFTKKVTARNVFRYKKKFLMTIIGVTGCTSLIIAGFGIRDAITKMIPLQYGEIFKYDAIINLKDDLSKNQIKEEKEKINNQEEVKDSLSCYMQAVDITSIKNSQNINLIVGEANNSFEEFITLKKSYSKENYTLEKDKILITEKIAKLLNLKVNDKIIIKDQENIEKEVTIGKITENYIGHYIYMSSDLYNELYGESSYKPNTIFIKQKENVDLKKEEVLGKKLLENKDLISGVTFLSTTKDIFAEVMGKMQLVVYVLIVAAGLLAFAVLYNLSNVNISEREREIATLKVLGFNDKEVFNYITKETRILTGIGVFLGLFFGYFLTMFIIKTCELDMLMFNKQIKLMSFAYGIIITIIFAEIVNIAVNHTLKKINMADSLKSVD